MEFHTTATISSFGGKLLKLSHRSGVLGCQMALNVYLPPQAESGPVPVLFYLSGLTCTGDNCAEKGGFQRGAAEKGIAVVYPDTSPRGLNIKGEDDSWDFGTGAGFYVDATQEPWSSGYKMYSYIVEELPTGLFESFPQWLDRERVSITGHSMGGHGALTIFLRNPGKFKSCSAFAPIANPINSAWGQKALVGYLGEEDLSRWNDYDATELVRKYRGPLDILIDVGTEDDFYKQGQLLPENFVEAANQPDHEITLRKQPGYDHGYYFISSFADDHIAHAAKYLLKG